MKAFHFRLGQILRWREQAVLLEEARVAASVARISAVEMAKSDLEAKLAAASREVASPGGCFALQCYEGFLKFARTQNGILQQQENAARKEHAVAMTRLLEANRNVRLLQNLRDLERRTWQREADRELADFAAEAFLARHCALSRAESADAGQAEIAIL